MIKYIFAFLILVVLVLGVWTLHLFEVISLKTWAEQAIVNTPFLKEYVETDTRYDELYSNFQVIQTEKNNLQQENEDLKKNLKLTKATVSEQQETIASLEEQLQQITDTQITEEEKLTKLVNIYEEMKPDRAASILAELELKQTLLILQNIDEEMVAEILAALPVQTAAQLSAKMQE